VCATKKTTSLTGVAPGHNQRCVSCGIVVGCTYQQTGSQPVAAPAAAAAAAARHCGSSFLVVPIHMRPCGKKLPAEKHPNAGPAAVNNAIHLQRFASAPLI